MNNCKLFNKIMSLLEEKYKNAKITPEYTAGPISRMLFTWMDDLFKKGKKKILGIEDIYVLDESRDPSIFYCF